MADSTHMYCIGDIKHHPHRGLSLTVTYDVTPKYGDQGQCKQCQLGTVIFQCTGTLDYIITNIIVTYCDHMTWAAASAAGLRRPTLRHLRIYFASCLHFIGLRGLGECDPRGHLKRVSNLTAAPHSTYACSNRLGCCCNVFLQRFLQTWQTPRNIFGGTQIKATCLKICKHYWANTHKENHISKWNHIHVDVFFWAFGGV